MKVAIVIVLVLVVLVVGAVGLLWYSMGKPLYKPGMVSSGTNLRAPLAPPEQSAGAQFWRVEPDIQLEHFSQGEGQNVIVVHGGPGHPFTQPWPVLDALADRYRFHYYDQRGCGQSTRPIDRFDSPNYGGNVKTLDQTLGIGAQLADIERIRRILGEDRLILIGHSFGGFLASLYAAEFPQHVEALILIAPADVLVMSQKEGGGLFEMVRERLPEDMRSEYDDYIKTYFDYKDIFRKSDADLVALNEAFAKYYLAVVDMPELEQEQEQAQAGGWMVQAMYFSMGRRHDYRSALGAVQAPVLVLHGADDLQSQARSQVYADAFPNGRLQVIENAAHSPFYTQPDRFLQLFDTFLSGL